MSPTATKTTMKRIVPTLRTILVSSLLVLCALIAGRVGMSMGDNVSFLVPRSFFSKRCVTRRGQACA
jgi:hypothetical protein